MFLIVVMVVYEHGYFLRYHLLVLATGLLVDIQASWDVVCSGYVAYAWRLHAPCHRVMRVWLVGARYTGVVQGESEMGV